MATKLFVGSFPLNTDEQVLKNLFLTCGPVLSFQLIKDVASGASRGFGFVEMTTEQGAQTAIEKLNGTQIGDRKIVVKMALAKTSYQGMNDTRGYGNRNRRRY